MCNMFPIPYSETHLTKHIYQQDDHLCKIWENDTALYRWKQKCLMVEGTIMKMGCFMEKKCHFKLSSLLLSYNVCLSVCVEIKVNHYCKSISDLVLL